MSVKRVSVRMDPKLHKALKHIAIEDSTTLQEIFIKAVEDKYLSRIVEREMKEA